MSAVKPARAPAAKPLRHDYRVPAPARPQIRELQQTALARTVATALFDHLAIFGLIALVLVAYAQLPLALAVVVNLLAWVGVARCQRGLECLVHEASHYNWDRRRQRLNDLLANLLAALPVFSTVEQYRVGHFVHHRMKGTGDDPCLQRYEELGLEELDRSSGARFAAGILRRLPRYVVGWWVAIRATPGTAAKALVWHAAVVVLPVSLLAGPTLGLAVWAQWMGAFALVLPVIRLIGEADEHKYIGTDNVFDATMVNDGWLLRLLIHPHNDGYHLTHHLWPGVPHHRLGRLHTLLEDVDPEHYARQIRRRTRILEDPLPARARVDAA